MGHIGDHETTQPPNNPAAEQPVRWITNSVFVVCYRQNSAWSDSSVNVILSKLERLSTTFIMGLGVASSLRF